MKTMKRKLFIPRKSTNGILCRVEDMGQIVEVPIEKAILKVLARLYSERRTKTDELA